MGEVLKLSPPWMIYMRKINALFGEDPDVLVQYDEEENAINLRVKGQEKADAISQILPTEKTFGNVTVKINIIPANKPVSKVEVFQRAFEGNPVFSYALSIDTGMTSNTFNYVVYKHLIAQFYTDTMNNPNGITSMLYEDIAREVFEDVDGIMYSTDVQNNDGATYLVIKP